MASIGTRHGWLTWKHHISSHKVNYGCLILGFTYRCLLRQKKNHCRWIKYLILNKTLNELAYVNWTFEFDFKVIFRIKTHS